MTSDPEQLKIENALLRGSLYLVTASLKNYHDSKHTETEDGGMMSLTIPVSLRGRAADALERAEKMLKEPEQGRGR